MARVALAHEHMMASLDALYESLENLEKIRKVRDDFLFDLIESDELERALRDSVIQRFELCADLFWKFLKKYEEEKLGLSSEFNAPRPVITSACKAKMLSEQDAETFLVMMKNRKMTSHIYREEMADQISAKIPAYYELMRAYVERLVP